MLGKRFQRTVSMAHIGTASCNPNTEKAAAAMSTTEAEQQPISQWEILKHAEEMMMLMMAGAPAQAESTVAVPSSSETTRMSASTGQAQGAAMLQHSHSSEIRPAGFIPRVNFLDNCFFCKRRLKHERDIFIYRGDAAFCTEECRQRQIVKDERRPVGASSKKGGATTETAVAA